MRAPFQVLVFPYKQQDETVLFLICLRRDLGFWQPISGGGEDTETSLEAAKRELNEETALLGKNWLQLDSMCTLPKIVFNDHKHWPNQLLVVPEYAFSVEVTEEPTLSSELVIIVGVMPPKHINFLNTTPIRLLFGSFMSV